MSEFSLMNLWRDEKSRSPSTHMAIDEAILRNLDHEPSDALCLRFYSWTEPAVTIGFFIPFSDGVNAFSRLNRVESATQQGRVVRRLTGGGIVEHGNDVTFSLAAGKDHPLSSESTTERYRLIHEALRVALIESGEWPDAELAPVMPHSDRGDLACFSNPVGWDVVNGPGGEKIAGGAQRNSRGAWLHQGTVRLEADREISISAPWTTAFAEKLASGSIQSWTGCSRIEEVAQELAVAKYKSQEWNQRK